MPLVVDFLPSAEVIFDGVEGFGFPNPRVDCRVFFLGVELLTARSKEKM